MKKQFSFQAASLALVCSFVLSAVANAEGRKFNSFRFEDHVPAEQYAQLSEDLAFVKKLPLTSSLDQSAINEDKLLRALTHLTNLDGPSLYSWLSDRVQYIVSEDYDLSNEIVLLGHRSSSSLQEDLLDIVPAQFSSAEMVIVMTNLGAAIYKVGKTKGYRFGCNVAGWGVVPIRSPRTGLIQIGRGLFMNLNNLGKTAEQIDRVKTLFHEAHHSDGNGSSLTFPHIVCPTGHDYAGNYACDEPINGPYMYGALVLGHLARQCTACTPADMELLKVEKLDNLYRLVNLQKPENRVVWDDAPEGVR